MGHTACCLAVACMVACISSGNCPLINMTWRSRVLMIRTRICAKLSKWFANIRKCVAFAMRITLFSSPLHRFRDRPIRRQCRKSTIYIFHTLLLFRLKFGDVPFGVDPWCWGLQSAERRSKVLANQSWNYFQEFPPDQTRYLNVTDRRTELGLAIPREA